MSPEVIDDITEEVLVILKPYGGALHVHVDKDSPQGNIFVKSVSIAQGEAAVNALHKKEFSGNHFLYYSQMFFLCFFSVHEYCFRYYLLPFDYIGNSYNF